MIKEKYHIDIDWDNVMELIEIWVLSNYTYIKDFVNNLYAYGISFEIGADGVKIVDNTDEVNYAEFQGSKSSF